MDASGRNVQEKKAQELQLSTRAGHRVLHRLPWKKETDHSKEEQGVSSKTFLPNGSGAKTIVGERSDGRTFPSTDSEANLHCLCPCRQSLRELERHSTNLRRIPAEGRPRSCEQNRNRRRSQRTLLHPNRCSPGDGLRLHPKNISIRGKRVARIPYKHNNDCRDSPCQAVSSKRVNYV